MAGFKEQVARRQAFIEWEAIFAVREQKFCESDERVALWDKT